MTTGLRKCAKHWGDMLRGRSGQHSVETAILIGFVAVAVIAIQPHAREAMSAGVMDVVNNIFGTPGGSLACPDFDHNGVCDQTENPVFDFNTAADFSSTEQSPGGFLRITDSTSSVIGSSKSRQTRSVVFTPPASTGSQTAGGINSTPTTTGSGTSLPPGSTGNRIARQTR